MLSLSCYEYVDEFSLLFWKMELLSVMLWMVFIIFLFSRVKSVLFRLFYAEYTVTMLYKGFKVMYIGSFSSFLLARRLSLPFQRLRGPLPSIWPSTPNTRMR